MKKYLIIDILIMIAMAFFIVTGNGNGLAVWILFVTFALGVIILAIIRIEGIKNKYYRKIQRYIDSGEYTVYLNGNKIEDPQGIDITMYEFNVDTKKKIIRFTNSNKRDVRILG